jgi:hypothetical protein
MAPIPIKSRVLMEVARRFQRTKAARTGVAGRSRPIDYEDLLQTSGSKDGEERRLAERDLELAEQQGLVEIIRHRRTGLRQQVRVIAEKEPELFAFAGMDAPSAVRAEIQALFEKAADFAVPEIRQSEWLAFCVGMNQAAKEGRSIAPFDKTNVPEIEEMLVLLAKLLSWNGESLIRFASSLLCRNSKRLEELQARLDACLVRITNGSVRSLSQLGILPNERSIWLHGPLKILLPEGEIDLGLLHGPARLSLSDLKRGMLAMDAPRFLTVENQAMFHELCKVRSGTLLASSGSEGGFAHSAVIDFLRMLPGEMECWHFGDSDPKGFEIMADLRERSGRTIHSLQMIYRPDIKSPALTKEDLATIDRLSLSAFLISEEKLQLEVMRNAGDRGNFEQESLGPPSCFWPPYPLH